jgi:hypothetical protein
VGYDTSLGYEDIPHGNSRKRLYMYVRLYFYMSEGCIRMPSESSEYELKPETALELIRQATSINDMLDFVRHHVIPYFVRAIYKAEADDVTKAAVVFYLGEIEEALSVLDIAFSVVTTLRLSGVTETEEQLLSRTKEQMMTIIHMYADIKNGMPLEDVVSELEHEANYLHEVIRNYNAIVSSEIRNLREELRKITANV